VADHVELTSEDVNEQRIEALKELFPEAVTEAGIDWDRLRQALGEAVDTGPERYSFSWAGRSDAFRAMQAPSNATLVPCPEESVDFDETENIFIEGENLEVLKLLQKSYFGKVKMIYIDPPYNTGNDFVYKDDFRDSIGHYLRITGQVDEEGARLTTNPETSGRFHSDWLTMMYPRLFLAHNLLREDGVIFVSIDDTEVANLRMIMNDIFGEENFLASVVWQKRTSPDARANLGPAHDYILVFARASDLGRATLRNLPLPERRLKEYSNPDDDPRGPWASRDITGQTGHAVESQYYEITAPSGRKYSPPQGRCWAISESSFRALVADNRVWFGQDGAGRPRLKLFLSETEGMTCWTWWTNKEVGHNQEATKELNDLMGSPDAFDNPKPARLLRRMVGLATTPGHDIVLDFFAGSCTTAQAALELNREDGGNRRFIMVQLPEPTDDPEFATIAEMGKERIRRVIARMKEEDEGKLEVEERDEDLGFKVFKLARSNYKVWEAIEEDEELGVEKALELLRQQLTLFENGLVEGARDEDVIYENLIKEGYTLNANIEPLNVGEQQVHRVSEDDRFFYICLDRQVEPEALQELEGTQDTVLVCLDAAMDDSGKANLAEQFHLKTI